MTMKYQFNIEWYDEYGVKAVVWDAQDPEQTKKDLIESGSALEENIYIYENIGQAHYDRYDEEGELDWTFYDGYRYDADGKLYWEFKKDE